MKIINFAILLPSPNGKIVPMNHEMSEDEIEECRKNLIATMVTMGFPGAVVTLTTYEGKGEIEPIEKKSVNPLEVIEEHVEEVNVETLPQYRKRRSILDYFKK